MFKKIDFRHIGEKAITENNAKTLRDKLKEPLTTEELNALVDLSDHEEMQDPLASNFDLLQRQPNYTDAMAFRLSYNFNQADSNRQTPAMTAVMDSYPAPENNDFQFMEDTSFKDRMKLAAKERITSFYDKAKSKTRDTVNKLGSLAARRMPKLTAAVDLARDHIHPIQFVNRIKEAGQNVKHEYAFHAAERKSQKAIADGLAENPQLLAETLNENADLASNPIIVKSLARNADSLMANSELLSTEFLTKFQDGLKLHPDVRMAEASRDKLQAVLDNRQRQAEEERQKQAAATALLEQKQEQAKAIKHQKETNQRLEKLLDSGRDNVVMALNNYPEMLKDDAHKQAVADHAEEIFNGEAGFQPESLKKMMNCVHRDDPEARSEVDKRLYKALSRQYDIELDARDAQLRQAYQTPQPISSEGYGLNDIPQPKAEAKQPKAEAKVAKPVIGPKTYEEFEKEQEAAKPVIGPKTYEEFEKEQDNQLKIKDKQPKAEEKQPEAEEKPKTEDKQNNVTPIEKAKKPAPRQEDFDEDAFLASLESLVPPEEDHQMQM